MYERFLRRSQQLLSYFDDVFNFIFLQDFNPAYFLGGLTNLFLWFCIASGLLLFFYYVPSLDGAYASVQYLMDKVPYGGAVRGFHRYAADGFMLLAFLHGLRTFFTDRFRKFRILAYLSGVVLITLTLIVGLTGYLLVWDERSLLLTNFTVSLLRWIPGIGGALAGLLLGGPAITEYTLPRMLFLHITPPFLMLFFLWMHYIRINRPIIYPPAPLTMLSAGLIFAVAGLYPAQSQAPANLDAVPTELVMDWFFLWGYWLLTHVPPGAILFGSVALLALVAAAPYLARRNIHTNVPVVNETRCTGCNLCYVDCHANAITMVPAVARGSRTKMVATINPNKCAECGICVGACVFGAIEMPLLRDAQIQETVLAHLKSGN